MCCYQLASARTFLVRYVSRMQVADMLISAGSGINMLSLCFRMCISLCFVSGCLNMVSLPPHHVSWQSHSASLPLDHLGSVPGRIPADGSRRDNLPGLLANLLTIGTSRTKLLHCITLRCFKLCLNSCSSLVHQKHLWAVSRLCVAY